MAAKSNGKLPVSIDLVANLSQEFLFERVIAAFRNPIVGYHGRIDDFK